MTTVTYRSPAADGAAKPPSGESRYQLVVALANRLGQHRTIARPRRRTIVDGTTLYVDQEDASAVLEPMANALGDRLRVSGVTAFVCAEDLLADKIADRTGMAATASHAPGLVSGHPRDVVLVFGVVDNCRQVSNALAECPKRGLRVTSVLAGLDQSAAARSYLDGPGISFDVLVGPEELGLVPLAEPPQVVAGLSPF